MAVFSKQGLITELLDRTELIKASTQGFLRLTNEQLNFKPDAGQWSIAENFEHLNICNGGLIRSILARISGAPDIKADKYTSGWLGELIYAKMMPRPDGSVFKMRTRKTDASCAGRYGCEGDPAQTFTKLRYHRRFRSSCGDQGAATDQDPFFGFPHFKTSSGGQSPVPDRA